MRSGAPVYLAYLVKGRHDYPDPGSGFLLAFFLLSKYTKPHEGGTKDQGPKTKDQVIAVVFRPSSFVLECRKDIVLLLTVDGEGIRSIILV
jgi:hypothetical protein